MLVWVCFALEFRRNWADWRSVDALYQAGWHHVFPPRPPQLLRPRYESSGARPAGDAGRIAAQAATLPQPLFTHWQHTLLVELAQLYTQSC